ncbi:hypothetical protein AGMMS50262_14020 [Bacteroidia bacterium]|nr:hypothetical protein AGMMS50262_14020 [Bacteroidia bacterium]
MIKNLLKKTRRFFWTGIREVGGLNIVRRQCNNEDIELRKRLDDTLYLEQFGFKVYSQNDEDGIIEEIFNRIETTNKQFVEFGVGNGLENNTHYLLHKGWNGLWIEGNKKSVNEIDRLFKKPIDNKKLTVINAFITKDNINSLIAGQGKITGEIDLLNIDIDGNDYWVWEAITCIKPRVVVIEYNAKFPPNHEWIMEYDAKYVWQGDDESGASLKSLELLGAKLGYQLVGTNVTGLNAFFVKAELAKELFVKPATAEKLYNSTRWTIQYISGHPSQKYIGK